MSESRSDTKRLETARGADQRVERERHRVKITDERRAVPLSRYLRLDVPGFDTVHPKGDSRQRERERSRLREASVLQIANAANDGWLLRPIVKGEQRERSGGYVRRQVLPEHVRVPVVPAAITAHAIDQQRLAFADARQHVRRARRARQALQP